MDQERERIREMKRFFLYPIIPYFLFFNREIFYSVNTLSVRVSGDEREGKRVEKRERPPPTDFCP